MRALISGVFLLTVVSAVAQDAGIMAAQQAAMASQQASDQAALAAQQASQQAAQQAQWGDSGGAAAAKPKFSLAAGSYPGSTTLKLKDRTRGAVIYYTTDGWTPTVNSTRYTGPITISATTAIQAIAVAPGFRRSQVASAVYTLPAAAKAADVPIEVSFLNRGMPIPLMFTASVSSKGLDVGDKLPVALAQDLIVGGTVVAPKAAPVLATVTQVDNRGLAGAPGSVTFAVHSIVLNDGEILPLAGTETMEGQTRLRTAQSFALIPVVGFGGILVRGREAEIPQGAMLTAVVDRDLPARASK